MRSRGKEEQIQLIDTHNQGFLSVWRREGFELKPTTNLFSFFTLYHLSYKYPAVVSLFMII